MEFICYFCRNEIHDTEVIVLVLTAYGHYEDK